MTLWRAHREGLSLIPAVDSEAFKRFESQHRALNDALMAVLIRAEQANLLRDLTAEDLKLLLS